MNLYGICKYESGASFLKSPDSSVVQLLHGLKLQRFGEGQHSPCSRRTHTTPEPGYIPARGCHQGKQRISSFLCGLRVTPLGNQLPGQSCRATRGAFLLALLPQGRVAESSWLVLLVFDQVPSKSLKNKTLELLAQVNTRGSRRKQISTSSKNFSLKGLKIDFSRLGNSSLALQLVVLQIIAFII